MQIVSSALQLVPKLLHHQLYGIMSLQLGEELEKEHRLGLWW